ncbi:MAG: FAD:protein FMN transferase [Clostridia bacterium]|nr:FAD:protein FMN transferase [Clostridia bacterium]
MIFFVHDPFHEADEHFGYAMGSEIVACFYGGDNKETADTLFSEINVLDTDMLSAKSEKSEIYSLNEKGSQQLSDEALPYINSSLEICKASQGALDITIGSLSSLWGFDSSSDIIPDSSLIETEKSYCGYEKIVLDGNTVTLSENQKLDMGALGKGIACDKAKDILSANGTKRALISVGGTILTYSDGKDYYWHDGWGIAVRTPETDDSSPLLRVHVTDTKVFSTSGDYEKYFKKDGKRYHHILNPGTGYPAETGLKSVTIIADSGLVADGLSTACFVLGREKSQALLEQYNAEAIFVDKDNNVYITDGIFGDCTLLNDAYTVKEYE